MLIVVFFITDDPYVLKILKHDDGRRWRHFYENPGVYWFSCKENQIKQLNFVNVLSKICNLCVAMKNLYIPSKRIFIFTWKYFIQTLSLPLLFPPFCLSRCLGTPPPSTNKQFLKKNPDATCLIYGNTWTNIKIVVLVSNPNHHLYLNFSVYICIILRSNLYIVFIVKNSLRNIGLLLYFLLYAQTKCKS